MRYVLCLLICLLPQCAHSAKRMALIIGNDSYLEVAPLQKAVADAKAIANTLENVGFETMLGIDLKRRDFNLLVSSFTAKLEPGDTAFVFFAGHGVEINGENLLLPTDIAAPENVAADFITSESIALSQLLDRVRRTGARTTLAIIDACRDNPFANSNGRSIGRSRGLGRIAAPEGTFVLFSAGAGQQALDRLNGDDRAQNSVFTRLLLPKLTQANLELREMISTLRVEVRDLARTQNHAQFPAYYDELLGDFYFKTAALREAPQPVISDAPAPVLGSSIREDFALARQIGTASAIKAFLAQHEGSTDFSIALAQDMLEKLEPATAPSPRTTQPAKDTRPSNAAKPRFDQTGVTQRSQIKATQQQLARLGCNPGGADGVVGGRTRAAFSRFLSDNKTALDARDLGSQAALNVLKAANAPACTTPKAASVVKAAAPTSNSPSLTGTWTFQAKCPLFITTTGTLKFRPLGGTAFHMDGSDSLGLKGRMKFVLTGRSIYGDGIWGGAVNNLKGTLAANGKSMSYRTSVGCNVKAHKN